VALGDEMEAVLRAELGELLGRDRDALGAGAVLAFADQLDRLLAEAEALPELQDPVVDLAEEAVAGDRAWGGRGLLLLGALAAFRDGPLSGQLEGSARACLCSRPVRSGFAYVQAASPGGCGRRENGRHSGGAHARPPHIGQADGGRRTTTP
jgi:hypothetical protein